MSDPIFTDPAIEQARAYIERAFAEFSHAVGCSTTTASEVLAGDRAFMSRLKRRSMTFSTFDQIAGRLSALWPENVPWPAGFDRYPPTEVPASIMAVFEDRLSKTKLPGNAEWPADIPRTGSNSSTERISNG